MNSLTQREKEITALVATGASNKQIARQLFISERTVRNMLTNVFDKTSTQSRTQLAVQWVCAQNSVSMPVANFERCARDFWA
jgi:DNA-binding CsgD family transcriptional regulator